MLHALRTANAEGFAAVLVGTDCPALSAARLEATFTGLESGVDVVFRPAMDGGYVCVATGAAEPTWFEHIA